MARNAEYALSTVDNPYNPITQWDQWYQWDMDAKYNTCAYLARIARTSYQLSDAENDAEYKRAMQEIVDLDPFNRYILVTESTVLPKVAGASRANPHKGGQI